MGRRRLTRRRVPGDGDCLFTCFKLALAEVGVKTSTQSLRAIVAHRVTQDQFETLQAIFQAAKAGRDPSLLRDYGFMEGVRTLQDLRSRIMDRYSYWGDELAVRALEDALGVRALIYRPTPSPSGMVLRRTLDLKEREEARPEMGYYVLLWLRHQHYELLQLDRRGFVTDKVPETIMGQRRKPSKKAR